MKNYILHIGLPKTGTTTLQNHLFSKLGEPSLYYNPPSITGPLTEAVKLLDFGMLQTEDLELLRNIVTCQGDKIPQNNILISNEILSQRLMKFNFAERVHFLKSIFPDATIILTLKHQPELLRGLYQQHVSQNYFLKPREVFIPFSDRVFPEAERWKECMRINVKEWNYTEAIRHFRTCYAEKFHVLFFENHSKNIMGIGEYILRHAGISVSEEMSNLLSTDAPRLNSSYSSITMCILLNIAYCKLAFHSNTGFDSLHMQDLMEQANQSRHLFNASSVEGFLKRMKNRKPISRAIYTPRDQQILRFVFRFDKRCNRLIKPKRYELPRAVKSYLESESKILNSSLPEVVDHQEIPKQYL